MRTCAISRMSRCLTASPPLRRFTQSARAFAGMHQVGDVRQIGAIGAMEFLSGLDHAG